MSNNFTSDEYKEWIQSKPSASEPLSANEVENKINNVINNKVNWDEASKIAGRPLNHSYIATNSTDEIKVSDLTVSQFRDLIRQEVSTIVYSELCKLHLNTPAYPIYYQPTPSYPWDQPTVYCNDKGNNVTC